MTQNSPSTTAPPRTRTGTSLSSASSPKNVFRKSLYRLLFGVGSGVGVGVGSGTGNGVATTVGVGVSVGTAVAVGVTVAVGVATTVAVGVLTVVSGVTVAVPGALSPEPPSPNPKTAPPKTAPPTSKTTTATTTPRLVSCARVPRIVSRRSPANGYKIVHSCLYLQIRETSSARSCPTPFGRAGGVGALSRRRRGRTGTARGNPGARVRSAGVAGRPRRPSGRPSGRTVSAGRR